MYLTDDKIGFVTDFTRLTGKFILDVAHIAPLHGMTVTEAFLGISKTLRDIAVECDLERIDWNDPEKIADAIDFLDSPAEVFEEIMIERSLTTNE